MLQERKAGSTPVAPTSACVRRGAAGADRIPPAHPAWGLRALGAFAVVHAIAACTYDFDDFESLGAPIDASGQGGSDAAGGADAARDSAGKGDVPVVDGSRADTSDASREDASNGGRSGAGGAGGSGAGGAGTGGGAAGSSGTGGASAGGAGGAGGSNPDGAAGAGGAAGSSTGGNAGAGGTSTGGMTGVGGNGGAGGNGGSGTGGAGTGGAGTSDAGGSGGKGGTSIDAGAPDARIDVSADSGTPPFDCAQVGGRVFEGRCYFARTTPVTWDVGAQRACAPAHLVTITSAQEQDFVSTFLPGESRWIGLRRPASAPKNPSSYVWITGEANTFGRWYSSNGEPDYDGECVRLGSPDRWGDHPCSAQFPVICERD
jgi:hypothetical protein